VDRPTISLPLIPTNTLSDNVATTLRDIMYHDSVALMAESWPDSKKAKKIHTFIVLICMHENLDSKNLTALQKTTIYFEKDTLSHENFVLLLEKITPQFRTSKAFALAEKKVQDHHVMEYGRPILFAMINTMKHKGILSKEILEAHYYTVYHCVVDAKNWPKWANLTERMNSRQESPTLEEYCSKHMPKHFLNPVDAYRAAASRYEDSVTAKTLEYQNPNTLDNDTQYRIRVSRAMIVHDPGDISYGQWDYDDDLSDLENTAVHIY